MKMNSPRTAVPDRNAMTPASSTSLGPSASLRRLALHGSAWTILGYGASQILRLAGNLVLTRLLFPEAFGLSALVAVFITGLAMFSDMGIGPSVIRSHRGEDPLFLDTAWTIQVIRGLILWVASSLIAWPLAHLYGQPQLIQLLPVAGLSAAIAGFGSTALFTCVRGLSVARLTVLELIAQGITIAWMTIHAYLVPTVWALVIGSLIGALARTALSHTFLPGVPNRFCWEPQARREISGLARWIFVNSSITFLAMQFDRLMLGGLVPLKELGVYSIAAGLAQIPRDLISRLGNSIAFPMLSRFFRQPDGNYRKVRSIHRILVFASSAASGIIMAAGPAIIGLLYDGRYQAAGPILSLLALGAWLQTFTVSYYAVILAAGKPSHNGFGMATRLAIMAVLSGPVFRQFGVLGIATLASLSELGVSTFCFCGARRIGMASPGIDLQAAALAGAAFLASRSIIMLVF
jgi:O-antigen/teichoic acid export membrane protein